MFSRRTAWSTDPSPHAVALAALGREGPPLLDLTLSNPTRVGLTYAPDLYRDLADEGAATYDPLAFGLPAARAAVAGYYADRGAPLDPARVGLTASTSEAYAHLLALLCDPGDTVLVPRPGYPLLRYLADLANVQLAAYPLGYDGAWHLDLPALRAALGAAPRARAVVVVAPNNPTGNYLSDRERAALDALCAERRLAVLVDEVFHDYPLDAPEPPPPHLAHVPEALTFALSGLSKVAALPQVKLAWYAAAGPTALVDAALARLEIIADTFLGASTPIQRAAGRLLHAAPGMQARIRERTRGNLARLRAVAAGTALTVLTADAGWTALVRLPRVADLDDAGWVLRLAARQRLLVQPGYLYDLDGAHIALSLLTEPAAFADGLRRLDAGVAEVLRHP